jgi:hypothetical protein
MNTGEYGNKRGERWGKDTKKHDYWPTPQALCDASTKMVKRYISQPSSMLKVLDPGCGDGVWGNSVLTEIGEHVILTGMDIRQVQRNPNYENWIVGADYLTYEFKEKFDLIIGNPPYKYAQEFIEKSLGLLNNDGVLSFLIRLSFLEGRNRQLSLFQKTPPDSVHVLTRRIKFFKDSKYSSSTAFAIFVWKKEKNSGYSGLTFLNWLYWE